MRKLLVIFISIITILFSCGQENKSTSVIVTKGIETSQIKENIENQKNIARSNDKYIDTKYEYADSSGKLLIIENSLPKGGLKYTDPNGGDYIYAIFWTRITNETANPFELSIELPAEAFELPSSPNNHFKLFLPYEKMTIDKAPLFNYGLADLNAILANKLQKPSSLQRTINSQESSLFYVITLFKRGVEGTVRAGLILKNDTLYYRVNDEEILIGQFTIKNLKPNE